MSLSLSTPMKSSLTSRQALTSRAYDKRQWLSSHSCFAAAIEKSILHDVTKLTIFCSSARTDPGFMIWGFISQKCFRAKNLSPSLLNTFHLCHAYISLSIHETTLLFHHHIRFSLILYWKFHSHNDVFKYCRNRLFIFGNVFIWLFFV